VLVWGLLLLEKFLYCQGYSASETQSFYPYWVYYSSVGTSPSIPHDSSLDIWVVSYLSDFSLKRSACVVRVALQLPGEGGLRLHPYCGRWCPPLVGVLALGSAAADVAAVLVVAAVPAAPAGKLVFVPVSSGRRFPLPWDE